MQPMEHILAPWGKKERGQLISCHQLGMTEPPRWYHVSLPIFTSYSLWCWQWLYTCQLLHVWSGECRNVSVSMEKTPVPRIKRRRTRRLDCSCDTEFETQPVEVENVVTDQPTATNQMESDNIDDTNSEVAGNVVDENTPSNTNNPIGCELCLLLAHHWRICW